MSAEIPSELVRQARRQLGHPELHRTLETQLARAGGPVRGPAVSTELHPGCQMLAHSLKAHQDAALAVSQYFGIALEQYYAACEFVDRVRRRVPDPAILDFACGYGRLLNLLVQRLPPDRIWAAEIQPDAVAYVRDRFGVHALRSFERPEDFQPGRRFDLVWVASLFSHLPRGLFERWLSRLASLLSRDGVMLFTVHDQALLPPGMEMDEDGLLFIEGSENADLSTDIYGTTFVTEDYVRASARAVLGDDYPLLRLPRLIAYEQDAWVLGRPGRDLDEFATVPRGLRGWVDEYGVGEDRTLRMHGWTASMDDDRPVTPEITLDGEKVPVHAGEARPRVAEVLGKPGLAHSGWSAAIALDGPRRERYLRVVAADERGRSTLLFSGALDG